ncbi:MAG: glycosyltransferase family 2 protein [Bacteroidales bacterium]|nr:glycosyltransferase family 2 protein [Bacteroidales bacterium]
MNTNATKQVSVVIPCYNGAEYLAETIRSVLAQTVAVHEIIVVDDGSTDTSADLAESFGHPVRVIRQTNQGESVARNRGIEEAISPWVAFVDADDLWETTKIEQQLQAVQNHPEIVLVFTGYRMFGAANHLAPIPPAQVAGDFCRPDTFFRYAFSPSSAMVRRDLPLRFVTWTKFGEDRLYFLEAAFRFRNQLKFLPDPLTLYRKHAHQQTRSPELVSRGTLDFVRWADHANFLSDEERFAARRAMADSLTEHLDGLRWKREWNRFCELREVLRKIEPSPESNVILNERIYPRWVYTLKDCIDNIRHRSRAEVVQ